MNLGKNKTTLLNRWCTYTMTREARLAKEQEKTVGGEASVRGMSHQPSEKVPNHKRFVYELKQVSNK